GETPLESSCTLPHSRAAECRRQRGAQRGVSMSGRRFRRLAVAFVGLALLAATVLGVTSGLAAGRHGAAPRSAGSRPNASKETIKHCRAAPAVLRAHATALRQLRSDVLAKRIYLYTIGKFEGHPIFVPLTRAEFIYLITEKLVLGEITSRQAAQAAAAL